MLSINPNEDKEVEKTSHLCKYTHFSWHSTILRHGEFDSLEKLMD